MARREKVYFLVVIVALIVAFFAPLRGNAQGIEDYLYYEPDKMWTNDEAIHDASEVTALLVDDFVQLIKRDDVVRGVVAKYVEEEPMISIDQLKYLSYLQREVFRVTGANIIGAINPHLMRNSGNWLLYCGLLMMFNDPKTEWTMGRLYQKQVVDMVNQLMPVFITSASLMLTK